MEFEFCNRLFSMESLEFDAVNWYFIAFKLIVQRRRKGMRNETFARLFLGFQSKHIAGRLLYTVYQ